MTSSQLDILAEAISGWRDTTELAVRRRTQQRDYHRRRAIANQPPLTVHELAAELRHIWGTGAPHQLVERIGYRGKPESLVRQFYRHGINDMATRLEVALRPLCAEAKDSEGITVR